MRWTQSDKPQNKDDTEKWEKAGVFLYVERQDRGGAGKCGLKHISKTDRPLCGSVGAVAVDRHRDIPPSTGRSQRHSGLAKWGRWVAVAPVMLCAVCRGLGVFFSRGQQTWVFIKKNQLYSRHV